MSNGLSFSMMVSLTSGENTYYKKKKKECFFRNYFNLLCYSKEVPSPISNISQEEMQKLRKLVRIYCPFNFNHATKVKIKVLFFEATFRVRVPNEARILLKSNYDFLQNSVLTTHTFISWKKYAKGNNRLWKFHLL